MKRVLIFCLLLLLVAVGCAPSCNDDTCMRVLFIGNSYTYVNDLPSTFAGLAHAGGPAQAEKTL